MLDYRSVLRFACLVVGKNQTYCPNGGKIHGDESHGIPIRKKSPNKQTKHYLDVPGS